MNDVTETIREFLNKHNLNVERVTWTHLGDDKELDDPVILYDKNNLIPNILYVPARGNGKVLTTIRLLLKQLSKEPKAISPYRYREAIYKTVKPIRTDPEYKTEKQINYETLTKIAQELNFEQLKKYLETGIQAKIRKEFERMYKNESKK